MIIILMGIAYLLILVLLVRSFQFVHRWDEEISRMEMKEEARAEQSSRPKAA